MTTQATKATPMTPAQVEAYVDAAAAAIGLTLDARHRAGVIAYLSLAATMAAQLDALPLGAADEPAGPTFVPIAPGDLSADTPTGEPTDHTPLGDLAADAPPDGPAADARPGSRP